MSEVKEKQKQKLILEERVLNIVTSIIYGMKEGMSLSQLSVNALQNGSYEVKFTVGEREVKRNHE